MDRCRAVCVRERELISHTPRNTSPCTHTRIQIHRNYLFLYIDLLVDGEDGELHPVQDLPALGQEAVPHAGHHLLVFVMFVMCVEG